ncbi:MAG: AIPR family protein [Termitinemataceae bacterium]|nr:MAG: AIPR family protein [Termitinemataceae bacterium]
MDSITKSYLGSFVAKLGFDTTISEAIQFEHFSAFTMLSKEINSNLLKPDLEIISTGNAKGVDTIAYCINDKLILNDDEIDNFENQSMRVDVFFIQSKTSESFSDNELSNFLDVVIDFFSDSPKYDIVEFNNSKNIHKKLLFQISRIKIFLHCMYVTLGQEQSAHTSISDTIGIKKEHLKKINLFDDIGIELVDKASLISTHKKVICPLLATVKFENKTPLLDIKDVEEAYIGFAPFSEFKKLIMDENQERLKSLFNDNLRDFLGLDNPINQGIKTTLENGRFNEFSLLNNGVTVIAESNQGKGNTLVLENYQIVNGCQTSNVLFECRNIPDIDNVLIPLKVVITKNENLRDEIVLTTNSQSKIAEEQLFAITQFQKTLEDYYISQNSKDGLYYERRTNQYTKMSIGRSNIVEIKEQLKSYMAMFFDLPHLVAGNIGKIVANYKDNFFQKDHSPVPYYISGLISSKWEKLTTESADYKAFNKFRYHIFMGYRYIAEDLQFQQNYVKNIKNYSIKTEQGRVNSYDKLLSSIRNEELFKQNIDKAIELLKKTDYDRPKGAYSNTITQELKKHLQDYLNSTGESGVPN